MVYQWCIDGELIAYWCISVNVLVSEWCKPVVYHIHWNPGKTGKWAFASSMGIDFSIFWGTATCNIKYPMFDVGHKMHMRSTIYGYSLWMLQGYKTIHDRAKKKIRCRTSNNILVSVFFVGKQEANQSVQIPWCKSPSFQPCFERQLLTKPYSWIAAGIKNGLLPDPPLRMGLLFLWCVPISCCLCNGKRVVSITCLTFMEGGFQPEWWDHLFVTRLHESLLCGSSQWATVGNHNPSCK